MICFEKKAPLGKSQSFGCKPPRIPAFLLACRTARGAARRAHLAASIPGGPQVSESLADSDAARPIASGVPGRATAPTGHGGCRWSCPEWAGRGRVGLSSAGPLQASAARVGRSARGVGPLFRRPFLHAARAGVKAGAGPPRPLAVRRRFAVVFCVAILCVVFRRLRVTHKDAHDVHTSCAMRGTMKIRLGIGRTRVARCAEKKPDGTRPRRPFLCAPRAKRAAPVRGPHFAFRQRAGRLDWPARPGLGQPRRPCPPSSRSVWFPRRKASGAPRVWCFSAALTVGGTGLRHEEGIFQAPATGKRPRDGNGWQRATRGARPHHPVRSSPQRHPPPCPAPP